MSNFESWMKESLVPDIIFGKIKSESNVKDGKVVPTKINDISVILLTSKDTFMLTMCYKVRVNFEYNDGTSGSQALVIKKTPQISPEDYNAADFASLYHNEITAYTKLIPMLESSEKYPKYLYSHVKNLEAVIVLSDFNVDGWRMSSALFNLSLEHILLAVKELGQFHGTFYSLKHKDPQQFQSIIETLKESRYNGQLTEQFAIKCLHGPKRVIKVARERSTELQIPMDFLGKLEELLSDMFHYNKKMVAPVEPYAVLCHGDYLRNNLAFKYETEDKDHPTDVLMFDFQTLRYSSPMVDLTTVLSISAGGDVRSKHFDDIFKCYWESLTGTYCRRLNIGKNSIPEYLSYENLLREYIKYLPYAITIAGIFLMHVHEPCAMNAEEFMQQDKSNEELVKELYQQGGESCDKELRRLVADLYQLSTKHNVDIFNSTSKN